MVFAPADPDSMAEMRSSHTAVGWLEIARPPLLAAWADQSGLT